MAYDPTLKPKDMTISDSDTETSQDGNVVHVEATIKKTLWQKVHYVINSIKSADKHTFRIFWFSMLTNLAYVAKGLVGILTLTYYVPNWEYYSNIRQSKELAIKRYTLRMKREKLEQEAKDAEEGKQKVEEKTNLSLDEQMDQWMRKMRGEEC